MTQIRYLAFLLALVVFVPAARAQVRVIQVTDVHSILPKLVHMTTNIDRQAQEFLRSNPQGEVVIAVIGDYTSHNPNSRYEQGWMSMQALTFLRAQGYTVLFIPGNHDAFDWKYEIDGRELFIKQMQYLHHRGVKVLAANLRGFKEPLAEIIQPHYDLVGTTPRTRIVGMTLQTLFQKSNLTRQSAKLLFAELTSYELTWQRVLTQAAQEGVSNIVLANHDTFEHVVRQANRLPQLQAELNRTRPTGTPLEFQFPLLMSAHDHLAKAEMHNGSLVSGAGAWGSFSVVDLGVNGKLLVETLRHFSMYNPGPKLTQMSEQMKAGKFLLQAHEFGKELGAHPALEALAIEIDDHLADRNADRLALESRVKEFSRNELSIRGGRHMLGRILTESLLAWVRSRGWYSANQYRAVVAMVDPKSHDLSAPFTEISPRFNAMAFAINGAELALLYQSYLTYEKDGLRVYAPELNRGVRLSGGVMQLEQGSEWINLSAADNVVLVIDSWLVSERYNPAPGLRGQGILRRLRKLDRAPYLGILTDYLPGVLEQMARWQAQHRLSVASCRQVFTLF